MKRKAKAQSKCLEAFRRKQAASPKISEDSYKAAVKEGRQILADIDSTKQMRIGELADQVEKVYGEKRLKGFADDIGIALCTVERYRSVYRAWQTEDKTAPEPKFYSVAKALQAAPDRFELIRKNPSMTKSEAAKKMRERKEAAQGTPVDPQRKQNERWFAAVVERARKVLDDAGIADPKVIVESPLRETLRDSIEPKLLPTLLKAGEALIRLHDFCQKLVAEAPSADADEPREQLRAAE